ncbi:MAG: iron-sulfur cluster assembly scaffold protein [Candidatus Promineifilaceae bacterium]
MDQNMYREQMVDLFRNPLNKGEIENPTFTHEEDNPLCGDVVQIDVLMGDDGRVADVKWSGDGCAVSQVSASLLTEEIQGMTMAEMQAVDQELLVELLGIPLSMGRMKCAVLSLRVLQRGAARVSPAEGA